MFIGRQLDPLDMSDGARLAIITVACVAMGGLLYMLVEAPFMAWRDLLVPSNFRDDARPPRLAAAGVEPVSP